MSRKRMIEQLEECHKNNCPDCDKCIWAGEAISNTPSKSKQITFKHEVLEYDQSVYDQHPMMKKIIELFGGELI